MSKSEMSTSKSSRRADGQVAALSTDYKDTNTTAWDMALTWKNRCRQGALKLHSTLRLSQGILRRKEKLKAAGDSLSSSYLLNSDGAKQQEDTPQKQSPWPTGN